MNFSKAFLPALIIVLWTNIAIAQDVDKSAVEKCASVDKDLNEDKSSHHKQHNKTLHVIDGRDANDYYYGFNGPVDYNKSKIIADSDGPNEILAMLYANGYGVPQDLRLAKYYTCHSDLLHIDPFTVVGMLDKIDDMQTSGKGHLDVCDYAHSKPVATWCSALPQAKH